MFFREMSVQNVGGQDAMLPVTVSSNSRSRSPASVVTDDTLIVADASRRYVCDFSRTSRQWLVCVVMLQHLSCGDCLCGR